MEITEDNKKMNKKKIFLFLSVMDFGGQERFVSRLSQMLCPDYSVYIVLFDARKISYAIEGTVIDLHSTLFNAPLHKKIIEGIKRCICLTRELRKYRPIACISFGHGPNLINLLCRRKGTLVIPSIRGFASAERLVKNRFLRIAYLRADRIVCVSKGIKAKIASDVPTLQDKLCVVYNGYDCEHIVLDANRDFPTLPGNPKIVSVGTLRPEKGYWHLIKSIAVLKNKYPEIHLSIVGQNTAENGANLRRLTSVLHLENNICFEGWHSNPYVFVSASDIYVLSSVREGFPNALVEAMACGKPVVADDCLTGPREILSEKPFDSLVKEIETAEYGILVPRLSREEDYSTTITDEDQQLAKAIDLLLQNPKLKEAYGQKAAERAREFSYESCKQRIVSLLETKI